MSALIKVFAWWYYCPVCGNKVNRVPLTVGEYLALEIIYWVFFGIAFLTVGFFVQGFGG